MAQSNKDRADAMKAIDEYSQSLARNEVSWINNALNEPVKEKIKHTTNAWKVEGSPLNMTVGTGLSSMYSHGSMRRTVTIVKDASNIDFNMLVLICWTEFNFNPSLRAPKTSADSMLLQIRNLAFSVLFKCCLSSCLGVRILLEALYKAPYGEWLRWGHVAHLEKDG